MLNRKGANNLKLLKMSRKTQRKAINSRPRVIPTFNPYQDKDLEYFINTAETGKEQQVKATPVIKGVRATSLGEQLVADWLVKNNIRFKREKEFVDLVNPMTGKRLIIDFYLHSHKVVIEFDGRQHYKASKMFDRNGDSLEARIQRDSIKNAYCVKRGFKMVRIKYTDLNRIAEILTTVFKIELIA